MGVEYYYSKKHLCPVCNGDTGCKRHEDRSDDLVVLCLRSGDLKDGEIGGRLGDYRKSKNLSAGMGSVMTHVSLRTDREYTPEETEAWKRQQEINRENERKEAERKLRATENLNEQFSQRDRQYRQYFKGKNLAPKHRQNLQARGLTSGNGFYSGFLGMICPAYWHDGKVIGYQWLMDDKSNGKYKWGLTPIKDPKLNNGDKPITIVGEMIDGVVNSCEGFLKPAIAQAIHGGCWMGSVGGQFPELLTKKALTELGAKQIRQWVDAGSKEVTPEGNFKRANVIGGIRGLCEIANSLDIPITIGDWQQWDTKEGNPDCDEIPQGHPVEFREPVEFFGEDVASKGEASGKGFGNPKDKPDFDKEAWIAKKQQEEWTRYKKHFDFTANHPLKEEDLVKGDDGKLYFDFPTPDPNTMTCIRSGLGTGKTQWMVEKLYQALPGERFLQFGDKNGLLMQTAGKTNAYHVTTEDESRLMMADPAGRFAACIHSIIRFGYEDLEGANLVFDEATTLIKTMLFSKHLSKPIPGTSTPRRDECRKKWLYALKHARRIILLDGYLSDFYVSRFMSDLPDGMVVNKIRNDFTNETREYILHLGSDEKAHESSGFLSNIVASVAMGESVALASDSREWLEKMQKLLIEKGAKAEDIDVITQTTSGEDWAKEFLLDPDKYLQAKPTETYTLLYSPSMGEGVDISKVTFDRVFGYFSGTIGSTAQAQMLCRCRKVLNPIEVFVVPRKVGVAKDASTVPGDVIDLWRMASESEAAAMGGSIKQEFDRLWKETEYWTETASSIEAIKNTEGKNPRECLAYILRLNGGKVTEVTEDENSGLWIRWIELADELRDEKSHLIHRAEPITEGEAKAIKSGKAPKDVSWEVAQYRLARFQLTARFPGLEESEHWTPATVRLLEFDDQDIRNEVDNWILYRNTETDFAAMRRDDWKFSTLWTPRARFLMIDTLKALPLGPILEATEFTAESPIIKDWVKAIQAQPARYWKARLDWTPRKGYEEKPLQSLSLLLGKFGLGLVQLKQNGNVRTYAVDYSKHKTLGVETDPKVKVTIQSENQSTLWPLLEAGRRQKMLDQLAKLQEFEVTESSQTEPDPTNSTPLLYINQGGDVSSEPQKEEIMDHSLNELSPPVAPPDPVADDPAESKRLIQKSTLIIRELIARGISSESVQMAMLEAAGEGNRNEMDIYQLKAIIPVLTKKLEATYSTGDKVETRYHAPMIKGEITGIVPGPEGKVIIGWREQDGKQSLTKTLTLPRAAITLTDLVTKVEALA